MAQNKLHRLDGLVPIVKELKVQGKKIVTLNGAFDILHVGHLKILEEAKKQGDALIVGLNSDASVKMNKGSGRPMNNEQDRATMLGALEYVDYVVIFNEKDPRALLSTIKPDVHVNGSDYGEQCIEAEVVKENGGRIHVVKLIDGYSTTKLIQKITGSSQNE